jgi:hypothetical protein
LQKLRSDVVKGVLAYATKDGGRFFGPHCIDYTAPNSKENIYSEGFPDSSVYVYPKMSAAFAFDKLNYKEEMHLGVPKQFFEAFTVPGDVVGSFYCGGGTGAAAATMLGRHSVSVDIEPTRVMNVCGCYGMEYWYYIP